MPRPSIIPTILPVIESYLEGKLAEYLDQEGEKTPTLPTTSEGKVNVRELVRSLHEADNSFKLTWEQHFFNKKELFDAVNIVAEQMNVLPIGSRALDDDASKAVKTKIQKTNAENKKFSEELVEALKRNEILSYENQQLKIEIERLRNQIDSIYNNGEMLLLEKA